jgi:hypothetical protein
VVWNHATRTHTVPPDTADVLTAEFRGLLEHLGVALPRGDGQHHNLPCIVPGHEHRCRKLSVNAGDRVWKCQKIDGRGGGLRELREIVGVTPEARARVPVSVALARLAFFCEPGSDPLAEVPAEAVQELRERTGRHKKDPTLRDNLARFLAAVHERMKHAERTVALPYTQLEATRDHIPAWMWSHFLTLRLDALGGKPILSVWFTVEVGESGKNARMFRGTGNGGAFRATTLTFEWVYGSGGGRKTESVDETPNLNKPKPAPPSATLAASLATSVPRSDSVSLHRRRAVALLLADLAYSLTVVPESVSWTYPGPVVREGASYTVAELVQKYGERIRRTIRVAESFGWVVLIRIPEDPDQSLVWITEAGQYRLEIDARSGCNLRNELADRRALAWAEQQRVLREAADLRSVEARAEAHARHVEHERDDLAERAPWIALGDDRVRNAITGEVLELASLRV